MTVPMARRSLGGFEQWAFAITLAAEVAHDTRYELEALALKRQLEVELERVPGAPPRTRRSDLTWRQW